MRPSHSALTSKVDPYQSFPRQSNVSSMSRQSYAVVNTGSGPITIT
jgi:hypothetical protein